MASLAEYSKQFKQVISFNFISDKEMPQSQNSKQQFQFQDRKPILNNQGLIGDNYHDIINEQNKSSMQHSKIDMLDMKEWEQVLNTTLPAMNTEEEILKQTNALDARLSIKDYNLKINDIYIKPLQLQQNANHQSLSLLSPLKIHQLSDDSEKNLSPNSKISDFQPQMNAQTNLGQTIKLSKFNISESSINQQNQQSSQGQQQYLQNIVKNVDNLDKIQQLQNAQRAKQILNNVVHNEERRKQRITSLVQQFVHSLKLRSKFKIVSESFEKQTHFIDKIQDKSYFFYQKKKNRLLIKLHLLKRFFKRRFHFTVFRPISSYYIAWDILMIVSTILFLYVYSIIVFFSFDTYETSIIRFFQQLFWIVFLIDIFLNFNTAYLNKDVIVTDRKQIAKKYLSSFFFLDFSSFLVLFLKVFILKQSMIYNPNHDLLPLFQNFLVFLKIFSIASKKSRVEELVNLNGNKKLILRLVYQIGFTILAAHIENQFGIDQTWLKKIGIQDSSYINKYIYSIYWSVTTMATIGYGDITPANEYEATFVTITMILLSCIFAYSINNIGMILQQIEKESFQLKENISVLQRFLNRKNVNIQLICRVKSYLKFLAKEQRDRNKTNEDIVLSLLSNQLREEVTKEINSKVLLNFPSFCQIFSKETLEKIVFAMEEVLIYPNETIFYQDELDDCSVYFIQGGMVEIFIQNSNGTRHVLKVLSSNELFGEISLFTGLSRKASARSVNLSTIYKLSRVDLMEIISSSSQDFEKFKMVSDELNLKNYSPLINIECYTCQKSGHIASHCPYTSQCFDTQFVILKNAYSVKQSRIFSSRSYRKRYHPRNKDKFSKNQQCKDQLTENLDLLEYNAQFLINYNLLVDGECIEESDRSSGNEDSFLSTRYEGNYSESNTKLENQKSTKSYSNSDVIRQDQKESTKDVITDYDSPIEINQLDRVNSYEKKSNLLRLKSGNEPRKSVSIKIPINEKKSNPNITRKLSTLTSINLQNASEKEKRSLLPNENYKESTSLEDCDQIKESQTLAVSTNKIMPHSSSFLKLNYLYTQISDDLKSVMQKLDNKVLSRPELEYVNKSNTSSGKDLNSENTQLANTENQKKVKSSIHKLHSKLQQQQNPSSTEIAIDDKASNYPSSLLFPYQKSFFDFKTQKDDRKYSQYSKKLKATFELNNNNKKAIKNSLLQKLLSMIQSEKNLATDLMQSDRETYSENEIERNFDRLKNYKYYLTHNNYLKIQQEFRRKSLRLYKFHREYTRTNTQRKSRRDNIYGRSPKHLLAIHQMSNYQYLTDPEELNHPTSLAYGVGIKGSIKTPKKFIL